MAELKGKEVQLPTEKDKLEDERYRKRAKEAHGVDGGIEFDDMCKVSKGDDNGAYVQAWVWVDAEEPKEDDGELPCERSPDSDTDGTPAWNCDNDHTGCLWNDGHNTCMHPGESLSPLEDEDA